MLRQRQRANIVTNKAGQLEALFQRLNQPPVLYLNMWHVANNAAFRVNCAGQNHRDGDEFTDLALTAFDKMRNGIQQRVFKRLLRALRKG